MTPLTNQPLMQTKSQAQTSGPLSGLYNRAIGSMPTSPEGYLSQIPGVSKEYYDPFIQRGASLGDLLSDRYSQIAEDPSAYISGIMGQYQETPAYKLQRDLMSQAAANTAAAGGYIGTPLDQMRQQEITQALQSRGMQEWLQNVMGAQQAGLGGAQQLYGLGMQAATGLSGDISNVLGTQAQLAFQRQQQELQRKEDRRRGLLGLGASLLGSLFGGGSS
jgi:hypothetical protein